MLTRLDDLHMLFPWALVVSGTGEERRGERLVDEVLDHSWTLQLRPCRGKAGR